MTQPPPSAIQEYEVSLTSRAPDDTSAGQPFTFLRRLTYLLYSIIELPLSESLHSPVTPSPDVVVTASLAAVNRFDYSSSSVLSIPGEHRTSERAPDSVGLRRQLPGAQFQLSTHDIDRPPMDSLQRDSSAITLSPQCHQASELPSFSNNNFAEDQFADGVRHLEGGGGRTSGGDTASNVDYSLQEHAGHNPVDYTTMVLSTAPTADGDVSAPLEITPHPFQPFVDWENHVASCLASSHESYSPRIQRVTGEASYYAPYIFDDGQTSDSVPYADSHHATAPLPGWNITG